MCDQDCTRSHRVVPYDGGGRNLVPKSTRHPSTLVGHASPIMVHACWQHDRHEAYAMSGGAHRNLVGLDVRLQMLREVPMLCNLVSTLAVQNVADLERTPPGIVYDLTLMLDWFAQCAVPIVLAQETLHRTLCSKMQTARNCVPRPHEVSALSGLIAPVDRHCVVRTCATEITTPFRLGVISVGAGIDEDLFSADVQHDAERIGMSVRGEAQVPQWSGINEHPHLLGRVEIRAQDVIA